MGGCYWEFWGRALGLATGEFGVLGHARLQVTAMHAYFASFPQEEKVDYFLILYLSLNKYILFILLCLLEYQ